MKKQTFKVLFFGTPTFSVACLQELLSTPEVQVCGVVTQPDKPAGRGQELQASPIKKLAIENKIAVFQPQKIKAAESEFLQEIASLGPIDFGVVIAFGQILPQKILDYPKFGCLNIHASLLPRWRGAAPIQRALLAGDTETGVCIIKMEAGLDTGPVYSSIKIKIDESDSASSLHDKLSLAGAKLLIKTLEQVANDLLQPLPQTSEGITYAEKIKPSDLLIDWNESWNNIRLKVKTFSPKPGAYSFIDGKRLKILKVGNLQKSLTSHAPGYVLGINEKGILVQCSDAAIEILELQLEGKRAMLFSEFIKGYPGLEGKLLGS